MRYNTMKSTMLSCGNLSTASAVGRWEKSICLWKMRIRSWESQGVSRKESAAEQYGHWCCPKAGPGSADKAHHSSVSFSSASPLLFKWRIVHSCAYATLIHSLPCECVYRGYQEASIALALLLKQGSTYRNTFQFWVLQTCFGYFCPLNEKIM